MTYTDASEGGSPLRGARGGGDERDSPVRLRRADPVFLRSDTKIEPLSAGWYTWGHLVPPVQQALNLAFRQVPLMRSFVANPSVHEAAASDPALLGAPFVQLQQSDVPRVAELLAQTVDGCGGLIQLGESLMAFSRQLKDSANGYSIEALYRELPACLGGLVELMYDLDNQPGIRLNEELAYGDDLDNTKTQQISLCTMKDRDRAFFLNTPRLESPDRVILPMPFADARLDVLAKSRIRPVSPAELLDVLRVPEPRRERFLQYFTTTPPPRKEPAYAGSGVRVRYFGHACVLLQTSEVSILIDPLVVGGPEEVEAALTMDDLPDFVDYVFVTHNHEDHLNPEILLQLRGRIGRILVPRTNPASLADPSMKLALRALGFDDVTVMDPLDTVAIPDGEITSMPFYGEHADLNVHGKHAMHVRLKGRSFAFLADSNCLDRALYRRLTSRLGKLDTLFIGMECDGAPLTWLYSPYLPRPVKRKDDESRRLSGSDSERAWSVVEETGCTRVFVYAMGQEPWLQHLCGLAYTPESKQLVESNKLVERCRAAGLVAERLYGCREMTF
jgi:L-ascorbate metabolism protein UlaG (beta-lactamase superfamily)